MNSAYSNYCKYQISILTDNFDLYRQKFYFPSKKESLPLNPSYSNWLRHQTNNFDFLEEIYIKKEYAVKNGKCGHQY